MESPLAQQQEHGTLVMAGWARTQISLKNTKRLRTTADGEENRLGQVLRKELETRGETWKRPEDLLERLLSNTFRAWHESKWHDLAELRTRIAYLVEHDASDQSSQEFRPDASLQAAVQPHEDPTRDNPPYEAVARQLEEEDLYMAWLIKEAHLTPLEADVTRLKLQDPPQEHPGDHFNEREITDMLGRSLGSVKQA